MMRAQMEHYLFDRWAVDTRKYRIANFASKVCMRCLEKDVESRYQLADQVVKAIDQILKTFSFSSTKMFQKISRSKRSKISSPEKQDAKNTFQPKAKQPTNEIISVTSQTAKQVNPSNPNILVNKQPGKKTSVKKVFLLLSLLLASIFIIFVVYRQYDARRQREQRIQTCRDKINELYKHLSLAKAEKESLPKIRQIYDLCRQILQNDPDNQKAAKEKLEIILLTARRAKDLASAKIFYQIALSEPCDFFSTEERKKIYNEYRQVKELSSKQTLLKWREIDRFLQEVRMNADREVHSEVSLALLKFPKIFSELYDKYKRDKDPHVIKVLKLANESFSKNKFGTKPRQHSNQRLLHSENANFTQISAIYMQKLKREDRHKKDILQQFTEFLSESQEVSQHNRRRNFAEMRGATNAHSQIYVSEEPTKQFGERSSRYAGKLPKACLNTSGKTNKKIEDIGNLAVQVLSYCNLPEFKQQILRGMAFSPLTSLYFLCQVSRNRQFSKCHFFYIKKNRRRNGSANSRIIATILAKNRWRRNGFRESFGNSRETTRTRLTAM